MILFFFTISMYEWLPFIFASCVPFSSHFFPFFYRKRPRPQNGYCAPGVLNAFTGFLLNLSLSCPPADFLCFAFMDYISKAVIGTDISSRRFCFILIISPFLFLIPVFLGIVAFRKGFVFFVSFGCRFFYMASSLIGKSRGALYTWGNTVHIGE